MPHQSPPGTFEVIRKDIIEDPTFSAAAFRVAIWLAGKTDGWVLHVKHIADGTGLKPSTVQSAVRELRRRGLVFDEPVRTPDGRHVERWEARFRRDLVVITTSTPPENRGVDVTCGDAAQESTPAENSEVGATCGDAASTPAENQGVEAGQDASTPAENQGVDNRPQPGASPQVTSTPPENRGVDPAASPQVNGTGKVQPSTPPENRGVDPARNMQVTASQNASPQVTSTPRFFGPPNREDGVFREDLREDKNAARTPRALPAATAAAAADDPDALFEVPDSPNGDGSATAPRPTQRAKVITDGYAKLVPFCKWPAVNGVVLKAIKSEQYDDDQIRDAVMRLAEEPGRPVTVDTLRVEIEGFAPRSAASSQQRPNGHQPYKDAPQDAYRRRPRAPR